MAVTNVDFGNDLTTISATGKKRAYGTVHITYHLAYNANRTSGFVANVGRGAIDEDTLAASASRGIWTREGSTVKIWQVVQISDGSQNRDVIDTDTLKDAFVIKAYALK